MISTRLRCLATRLLAATTKKTFRRYICICFCLRQLKIERAPKIVSNNVGKHCCFPESRRTVRARGQHMDAPCPPPYVIAQKGSICVTPHLCSPSTLPRLSLLVIQPPRSQSLEAEVLCVVMVQYERGSIRELFCREEKKKGRSMDTLPSHSNTCFKWACSFDLNNKHWILL